MISKVLSYFPNNDETYAQKIKLQISRFKMKNA